jgi:hypothetical protein
MKHEDGTFSEPIWGDENGAITCYMEKLVFDYELGGDSMGSKVYPSPESTYRHAGDGLVEVEIRLKRVIEEMDHSGRGIPAKQALAEEKKRNEDPEWQEYQRLRLKFDHEWAFHQKRRLIKKRSPNDLQQP